MRTHTSHENTVHEPWYKFGVAALLLEMAIAVGVCGYSLFLTFHGMGGFPGKH